MSRNLFRFLDPLGDIDLEQIFNFLLDLGEKFVLFDFGDLIPIVRTDFLFLGDFERGITSRGVCRLELSPRVGGLV